MSDDELANDRTFLAWLRTGIAVMGLGFVVAKVALIVQPTNETASDQGLYAAAGILIVLCGGVLVVVGYLQHKTVLEYLSTDKAKPRPALATHDHRHSCRGRSCSRCSSPCRRRKALDSIWTHSIDDRPA